MNFATMLLATPPKSMGAYVAKSPKDTHRQRSGDTRRERSHNAYRQLMGDKEMTTAQIANAREISHMGCLSTLYELEIRGVIERCGTRPKSGGRGLDQIVWRVKRG